MRQSKTIAKLLKPLVVNTWLRQDAVRTILAGPSKGLRYRIYGPFRAPVLGNWEPQAQQLMVRHIHPRSAVYDIGANIGVHTLLMARQVGPDGRVYAFEPVPELHERLSENVALNPSLARNVETVQQALSDEVGTADFYTGENMAVGHLAASGTPTGLRLRVPTNTLDTFVFGGQHVPPSFMKIDVEGAESRVLRGAQRVLLESRPVLLVDLHTPEQDHAVAEILGESSYRAYRTDDTSRLLRLNRGWPEPDGLWGQVIAFPV
jgi:FkbM family methyltransferase